MEYLIRCDATCIKPGFFYKFYLVTEDLHFVTKVFSVNVSYVQWGLYLWFGHNYLFLMSLRSSPYYLITVSDYDIFEWGELNKL